jgi:large repetitive protein
LKGLAGNDRLNGQAGNDRLNGAAGNDILAGGGSRDLLVGGTGNDKLTGQEGADILIGGAGRDILTGGKGQDLFVFNSLSDRVDRIIDFNAATDLIDLRPIFASPDFKGTSPYVQLIQLVRAFQVGKNVEVQLDADGNRAGTAFSPFVTLQNTSVSAVGTRNFVVI